jgi:predicted HTH transcriptional regulator
MIVADGRTDLEKLVELLREPEQTALDFKATVDLSKPEDKLNIVKDLLALGNNPDGGYLLIGVADDGRPCLPVGSIADRRAFDGAKITDLIAKYVEGIQGVITQIHKLDGHEIVVVFAEPHADGLPLPTSKMGSTWRPVVER